jgi:prolyl-tRNA synthetase
LSEKKAADKAKDFGQWFDFMLEEAQLIDSRYGVKGFVVYRPNGMRICKRIYQMLEKELEGKGHQQVLFPLVIPFSSFKKEAEHIKGFEDQVFMIGEAGGEELDEKLVLRPTSETAIYPMCSMWLRSYQELPFKFYQSVAVYRRETKATRPLLRGREFLWIETHDLFATADEARGQVNEDLEIAKRVYDGLGLAFIVAEREEFDRFPGADASYAYDALLPDGHVLQIGTTHFLGQHFTKAYDVSFLDRAGAKQIPYSTCFGPGVSRTLAAIVATHGDNNGLVLPFGMAEYDVVVIPIPYKGVEEKVEGKAREVARSLSDLGYAVYVDSSDLTPGKKYFRWEMKGVPVRVEVGQREVEQGNVTLFRRDTKKRIAVKDDELLTAVDGLKKEILEELRRRAWNTLKERLVVVSDRDSLIAASSKSVIMKAPYCGAKECADGIKDATGGYEIRGRGIGEDEIPASGCVWCGRPAARVVYLARAF